MTVVPIVLISETFWHKIVLLKNHPAWDKKCFLTFKEVLFEQQEIGTCMADTGSRLHHDIMHRVLLNGIFSNWQIVAIAQFSPTVHTTVAQF